MNNDAWNKFKSARKAFRSMTEKLKSVAKKPNEIVYNGTLDEIRKEHEIKYILVADNPGCSELKQGRYLAGETERDAGKIARKFFHEKLDIDFDKEVIVLNKTPIHTPSTEKLRELRSEDIFKKSQKNMASILFDFHKALNVPVWIVGINGMKKGGIFRVYTDTLKELYSKADSLYKNLFLFKHFSRNCFNNDLKGLSDKNLKESLKEKGSEYRKRILGN